MLGGEAEQVPHSAVGGVTGKQVRSLPLRVLCFQKLLHCAKPSHWLSS